MPATRPVAVKLDPSIHARIQDLAKTQDRSTHYLMREAIAQYVDREERREALRRPMLGRLRFTRVSGPLDLSCASHRKGLPYQRWQNADTGQIAPAEPRWCPQKAP